MLKRRILFSLWCLFVILYLCFAWNAAAVFLLTATVLIFAVSALEAVLVRKKLSFRISGPEQMSKGTRTALKLQVANGSLFPVFRGRGVFQSRNTMTGETQETEVHFYLGPKETDTITLELGSVHCGKVQLYLTGVCCMDLFGVFSAKSKTEESEEVFVVPSYDRIAFQNTAYAMQAENGRNKGNEKSEITAYTEQMSYRYIHWKLSTKTEDIFARDDNRAGMVYSGIFIETSIDENSKAQFAEIADERMETAYQLSADLCSMGIPHKFIFYAEAEEAFQEISVTDNQMLQQALYALLDIRFRISDRPSLEEFDPVRTEEAVSIMAYVTDTLSYDQGELPNEQWIIPVCKNR